MVGIFKRKFTSCREDWISLRVALGAGILLGAAALLFSPLSVLLGLLLLTSILAITYRPEIGLLAILFLTSGLVDLESLPMLGIGPFSLHIADGILLILLSKLIIKELTSTSLSGHKTPLDFPLIWFTIAVLVSAVIAILNPSFDKDWTLRQVRPLTYYLCFFCVTHLVENKRQISFLIHGSFSIALGASLGLLFQTLFPTFRWINTQSVELVTAGQRFTGVERFYLQADRIIYPFLLISISFLAIRKRFFPSLLQFLRAGILAAGLFLTFQRNYWLTAGGVLLLLGLLIPNLPRIRLIKIGSIVVIGLVLLLNYPAIAQHRYVTAAWSRLTWGMRPETLVQDASVNWRLLEARHAVDSFGQHPLFGVGLRNFYRPAYPLDYEIQPMGLRWYIHNAYLWVLVDMGLFGFIPFIWFYTAGIWRGLTRRKVIKDEQLRFLLLGISLAILGQALTNLVAPNFIQSGALAVFPVLLGLGEVIIHLDEKTDCALS